MFGDLLSDYRVDAAEKVLPPLRFFFFMNKAPINIHVQIVV